MSASSRYLTKSRFKQALECPTKLFYTGKPEYLNNSLDNSFLAALAEGGYQVGALACTGGVEVTAIGHTAQIVRTRELLHRDEVTIYEGALEAQGLFVRVERRHSAQARQRHRTHRGQGQVLRLVQGR